MSIICYGLSVPPPYPYVSSVMVLGGGAFGRWWGLCLMNGISVLTKETPYSALLPCENAVKRQPFMSKEKGPHQTLNLLEPSSWTFQTPELWKIFFVLYKQPSLWHSVTSARMDLKQHFTNDGKAPWVTNWHAYIICICSCHIHNTSSIVLGIYFHYLWPYMSVWAFIY